MRGWSLSEREKQAVAAIARNMTLDQTASALGVAKTTVDTYRHRACNKLGIFGVAGLTHYAIQNKLVKLGDVV